MADEKIRRRVSVGPVLRGLQGGGDFVFTELSHCQRGESLVRSVDTTRGLLLSALEGISVRKIRTLLCVCLVMRCTPGGNHS